MNRAALALLAMSALILPAGCGGGPQGPLRSPVESQAVDYNIKAEKYYQGGESEKARSFYAEALRLSRSVENVDSIAMNLVSLAAVHRDLGRPDDAMLLLSEMLVEPNLAYPQERVSEAAALRAMIHMDAGELEEAAKWAAMAESFCGKSCQAGARVANLGARISFLRGQYAEAIAKGENGLKLSRSLKDEREEANSYRVMADSEAAQGRDARNLEAARANYEAALAMDKRLGLGRKVTLDLLGVADVLVKSGRIDEARGYLKRALTVAEANRDKDSAERARTRLGAL